MRVLDVTEVKLERIDLTSLTPHPWKPYVIPPNTVGVTTVLRYIATQLGTLKLHEEDVVDPSLMPWRMLLGMGWEAMGSQLYPNLIWQPKVLSYEGVAGHPDGYSLLEDHTGNLFSGEEVFVVDEFKLTARSLREKGAPANKLKDIRAEWMWNGQTMSYLAMAKATLPYFKVNPGAPLLARFHVMWAMGAYEKFTLDERYVRYLVEYEAEEVDKTWRMVQKNKGLGR